MNTEPYTVFVHTYFNTTFTVKNPLLSSEATSDGQQVINIETATDRQPPLASVC